MKKRSGKTKFFEKVNVASTTTPNITNNHGSIPSDIFFQFCRKKKVKQKLKAEEKSR